jgi:hypothetical protein
MVDTPDTGTSQLVTVNQNGVVAINAIVQALKAVFPSGTGTSATATTGAATLPANPAGFVNIVLPNGQPAKVPYYNV